MVLDRVMTIENIQAVYMSFCLVKKYFHLAWQLLKFPQCKNCLNEPLYESEDYIILMQTHQSRINKQLVQKIEFQDFDGGRINESHQKLMDILNESNSDKNKPPIEDIEVYPKAEVKKNVIMPLGCFQLQSQNFTYTPTEEQSLGKKASCEKIINAKRLSIHDPAKYQSMVGNTTNFTNNVPPPQSFTIATPMQSQQLEDPAIKKQFKIKRSNTILDGITLKDFKKKGYKINVQMLLIEQLRFAQYTFYCLCILNSISDRYISTYYSDLIFKNILVLTTTEDTITKTRYPFLVCTLAAEFLNRLGKSNPKVQLRCQAISDLILRLGEKIQGSMKNEDMLEYFLKEQTDHLGRSALEIIAENKFYDLLKNENVASIVGRIWYGSGQDKSLFAFSRIVRFLHTEITLENYNGIVSTNYFPENTVYSFQFYQYIKNCSARHVVNSVSTFFTSLLYQLVIYMYASLKQHRDDKIVTAGWFDSINNIANAIVYSIITNSIFYMIYIYKIKRNLKFFSAVYLDIVMLFFVLTNNIDMPRLMTNDKDLLILYESITYGIIITCGWIKVFGNLTITHSFGPFLRIIKELSYMVLCFIIVFCGINTVFATIFNTFFKHSNPDFACFLDSWITLFSASFGIYNFGNFTKMKIFGFVLLMSYITVTNIGIFNLIIAIINNVFRHAEAKADAENRAMLVLSYERSKWDDRYGLLILLPAPFNIFSIVFSAILLLVRSEATKVQLNNKLSKLSYFIIAVGNFIVLILASIALLPYAYYKSLLHSFNDQLSYLFELKGALQAVGFIFTRPFELVYFLWKDSYLFWSIVYRQPPAQELISQKPEINKDIIKLLRKVLLEYKYKNKKRFISLNDLLVKLGLVKKSTKFERRGCHYLSNSTQFVSFLNPKHHPKSSVSDSYVYLVEKALLLDSALGDNISLSDKVRYSTEYLIDKLVDQDRLIDIDRSLIILEPRVKLKEEDYLYFHNFNVRVFLRGSKKFLYTHCMNDPIYSYKKLHQLIFKIWIKFELLYSFLPEEVKTQIKQKLEEINTDEIYMKYHQIDEYQSEYDDTREIYDSSSYTLSSMFETIPMLS